ncbi:MAG: FAD-binding oxidoreductase, partial [Proteobacteria bacterium]|nr:FAD-binding oxidoreductase [Pseudomonadota bacterium]
HNREINGCLMRPLVEDAVTEHQELMRASGAERYLCKEGRVKLYRSAQSFAGDAFEREALQKHGVPFDIYDTSQFLEIEPHIKPIFYRAMKLGSSARVTDPGAVVQSYARCFVDNGGTFIKGDAATLTQAPDGMWCGAGIKAPNVVVALGPWAPAMLRPLGYDFLIGQKRGYHQHFKINVPIRHAIVDADIGYVMSPTMRGARIATGAEFAALDAPPNPVQIARVLPFARELFALEEAVEDISWMGSRPCTIDSLPIVGRAPNHKGLWLNIGHGHSGFTIGPATGKLLAQMTAGRIWRERVARTVTLRRNPSSSARNYVGVGPFHS